MSVEAVGGKTADDTGDLRQDVLEDDGDAKAHHEAHAQGLERCPCAVTTSNRPAAVPPTMMPKLPSRALANQKADGGEAHEEADGSSMGGCRCTKRSRRGC